MDNLINLLPDSIANQIAAGEVIQRPGSVIKELVENSVDAGAKHIEVEVKDAGKTLIRVSDDGKGMAPMDARMAFERHATSKISAVEDLFALTTMGFRGEALASIAAVSHTTLQTRTADADIGVKLFLEGSDVVSSEPVVCAVGATFSVCHLFFNVPARRKFLKSDETELRHVITELQRIAAVHPDISFSLRHNDQLQLKLNAGQLKQRIIDLFGKRLLDALLPLHTDTPMVRIEGFVSRPSHSRKRGALQYFFVNGRFMKHAYFHRTVMNAYESMIAPGEQPEYFIYLTVDPSSIDVNIHPTKTEIKFASESDISKILYTILREALMKGASIPAIDFNQEGGVDIPVFKPLRIDQMVAPEILSRSSSELQLPVGDHPRFDSSTSCNISDWETFYKTFEAQRSDTSSVRASTQARSAEEAPVLQVRTSSINRGEATEDLPTPHHFGDYAALSLGENLLIIHLKRARFKVLYEEFLVLLATNPTVISNRLIFPELIELGVRDATLLEQHLPDLQTLGFDISPMGQNEYTINAIPEGISAGAEEELLLQLLEECRAKEISTQELLTNRLVSAIVRKRVDTELFDYSPSGLRRLISMLLTLPDYQTTPEGKLIVTIVSPQELVKRFK